MTDNLSAAPGMGRCSVTGKMVPEDELVTIQGQRVCAEGKAILLQRLKAGEGIPGEMEKPGVLRRVGCIILDSIILGVPFLIVAIAVGGVTFGSSGATAGMGVVTSVIAVIYFGQMHAMKGQTLGKMAGKIVVVNMDGSPISMPTAYIRAVAYAGPRVISAILTLFLMLSINAAPGARNMGVIAAVGFIGGLVWLYYLVDCLFALFDGSGQRALHDRIAGTRVIMK